MFESGYGRGQEVVGLFHDKNRVNADIFINVQELDRPRVQLGQVLTNLLRNAIEAMATERSDDRIWIRLGTREGMAAIDVEDCGPGVPPGMDARLFDSFATTKPEGMGMGLAICRSILELHRGQLVHLRGDRGALFRLTLPPSAEEPA